jgi:hypothetical protein
MLKQRHPFQMEINADGFFLGCSSQPRRHESVSVAVRFSQHAREHEPWKCSSPASDNPRLGQHTPARQLQTAPNP